MTSFTGILSDLDRVLLSAEEIHDRVATMAAQIQQDYAGRVITVVVLMYNLCHLLFTDILKIVYK
jgi:hypoxanthine phosphoribosyltransferase